MKMLNTIMLMAAATVVFLMPLKGSLIAEEQIMINNNVRVIDRPMMNDRMGMDNRMDRNYYRSDRMMNRDVYNQGCRSCYKSQRVYQKSCCERVRSCDNCGRRSCCGGGGFLSGIVNIATAPIYWVTDGIGGNCCNY